MKNIPVIRDEPGPPGSRLLQLQIILNSCFEIQIQIKNDSLLWHKLQQYKDRQTKTQRQKHKNARQKQYKDRQTDKDAKTETDKPQTKEALP